VAAAAVNTGWSVHNDWSCACGAEQVLLTRHHNKLVIQHTCTIASHSSHMHMAHVIVVCMCFELVMLQHLPTQPHLQLPLW
jgi:hypothetical protein